MLKPIQSEGGPDSEEVAAWSGSTEGEVQRLFTMGDSFHEQLQVDSRFLRSDKRLDTELVDKLILQLNRIYPQILTDKEAHRFRNLDVPTCIRLAELLTHLQEKGEEACYEFYRALHLHVEEVYFSLPTRVSRRGEPNGFPRMPPLKERFVMNDRSPWFFLGCFSIAVGLALLYYCGDREVLGDPRKMLGVTSLGLGHKAKELLISYTEDGNRKP
ncbi:caspase recruitment domain-containing protein 19-like isoform X2 [Anguilla rostrata]|uniref:caspase recruitment domain-containing protein 19-like isoform X2 n=1 Tax=Anguilla rostrata TaxID=7938 RepID=UPI0030D33067